jgi:hypothetical protein
VKLRWNFALILIGCLLSGRASAQSKLLLPIVQNTPIAGAHGSLWTTETWILNASDRPILIPVRGALPECPFVPCSVESLPPHQTKLLGATDLVTHDVQGGFLLIDEDQLSRVTVNLRVRDLSRQHETWGTGIPVIPETEAARDPIDLLGLPVESAFRSLIRIYDFDPSDDHFVIARIYRPWSSDTDSDEWIAEVLLPLRPPARPGLNPGYAELRLAAVEGLPSSDTVRVEILPGTEDLRFWAFASVTHNETQHVTVVTP